MLIFDYRMPFLHSLISYWDGNPRTPSVQVIPTSMNSSCIRNAGCVKLGKEASAKAALELGLLAGERKKKTAAKYTRDLCVCLGVGDWRVSRVG